ncbi:hypothetical protein [Chitinophaga arvensicola]|uniref:Uncharacterized protein n=1 Tax=Chitinophaga arvensicola TaxID=29529 RepID=A0A1I0S8J1_9BACT|nr:hypothetical protein [Chitinophaga arvensicola]SEW51052.1 hypothetical protein SAMN04488122_4096 [Chitinophaga arvensicola]
MPVRRSWKANMARKNSVCGSFFTAFILFFRHNRAIRRANRIYWDKGPFDSTYLKSRKDIQDIDELFSINLGYLINWLIPVFMGMGWYALLKVPHTRLVADLQVAGVSWETSARNHASAEIIHLNMVSNDTARLYIPPAHVTENTGSHTYPGTVSMMLCRSDTPNPIYLKYIRFPDNSKLAVYRDDPKSLSIWVARGQGNPLDSVFGFSLEFKEKNIVHSHDTNPVGDGITLQKLSFEKSLTDLKWYRLSLSDPEDWYAEQIFFTSHPVFHMARNAGEPVVSSIISGKLLLPEINDPPIQLNTKDEVKLVFKNPVELSLKNNSEGLFVHMEGEATEIVCGHGQDGKGDNRMPTQLKVWNEGAPYLGAVLAGAIPLILALFFRQRKAL